MLINLKVYNGAMDNDDSADGTKELKENSGNNDNSDHDNKPEDNERSDTTHVTKLLLRMTPALEITASLLFLLQEDFGILIPYLRTFARVPSRRWWTMIQYLKPYFSSR